MDLSPRSRKFVNGSYEVRAGVVVPFPPGGVTLSFDLSAVCVSVTPERWKGQVRYAGHTLLSTEPVDNWEHAARLAQETLDSKIVEIFNAS